MFEIGDAVGNEDSRFSGKETLGTDDVVLKRAAVRRYYGLGSGEGSHTKNVAGDMRINRGQDIIEKDPRPHVSRREPLLQFADSQIGSGIYCARQCDSSTLSTAQLESQLRNAGLSTRMETYSNSCTITSSSELPKIFL